MKLTEKTKLCAYYIYYSFTIIVLMNESVNNIYNLNDIFEFVTPYLPFIGIALVFTKEEININKKIILILTILLALGTSKFVFVNYFLYIIIFYILFSNTNINTIVYVHFLTLTLYCVFLTIATFYGLIEPTVFMNGERIRRSLFFVHPNFLSLVLISIHTSAWYLFYKRNIKYKLLLTLSLFLFSYLCFTYFDTRSGGVSLIVIAICVWIHHIDVEFFDNCELLNKVIKSLWVIPILALTVELVITVIYMNDNLFLAKINSLLSGRLGLQHAAFNDYGYPLFGLGITFSAGGDGYTYVDSFYNSKIYEYGLILQVVFFLTISYGLRKLKSDKFKIDLSSYFLLILIFGVFSLEAFSEKETFSFVICPFILVVLLMSKILEEK